jgi:hypothetical protein
MKNTDYTRFFDDITQNHTAIGNGDGKNHFARIILNDDILAETNLSEFLSNLENIEFPFLILISYDHNYSQNESNNKTKHINGTFILLDKCEVDDYAAIDAIFDSTEEIGEDILGYLKEYYDRNITMGWVHIDEMKGEHIGPIVDNYHGSKFDFVIHEYTNRGLYYNPLKWVNNL